MTIDRSTVRKQFAERLDIRLDGLVEKVYPYQVGDFRGASPVTIVTIDKAERGPATVSSESYFTLAVHNFVLYALSPVQYVGVVNSGTDVDIPMVDTTMFEVGLTITLDDGTSVEEAAITNVDPGVSITIDELVNDYTDPKLYVWTESQSEDLLDQLEYEVSDEVRISNEDDIWLSIVPDGESVIDVVEVGGEGYRHEMIPIKICVQDYGA